MEAARGGIRLRMRTRGMPCDEVVRDAGLTCSGGRDLDLLWFFALQQCFGISRVG